MRIFRGHVTWACFFFPRKDRGTFTNHGYPQPFTLYTNFGLFQFSSKQKYDVKNMDIWGATI